MRCSLPNHQTLRVAWLFVALCLLSGVVPAAEPPEDQLTVETIDGETLVGSLKELSAERLSVEGAMGGALPLKQVIRVDWQNRRPLTLSGQDIVILANGDLLTAETLLIDEESLTAKWRGVPGANSLDIPLEMVKGVAWKLPHDPTTRGQVISQLHEYKKPSDQLTLNNENSLSGELIGFDSKEISIRDAAGIRKIAIESVSSLAMNPELIDFPKRDELRLLITLLDGSRFQAKSFSYHADLGVQVTTLFGSEIKLSPDLIVSFQVLGGAAEYLSDKEPSEYEFTSYLSLEWPLRRDRNVTGGPISLGGQLYSKGLGVHSQCEISYSLEKKYRRFQSVVGIDDHAGRRGDVAIEVVVDGKTEFSRDSLTVNSGPLKIPPIDLTNAETLTLIVKFGHRGDVQDHVNWGDALLIQ